MLFCPLDGTLLQIRSGPNSHFYCSTCPYSSSISVPRTMKTFPKRKKVDDILGGETAWENVDRTAAVCPQCSHPEAYFLQIQIPSADEPMSIFFKVSHSQLECDIIPDPIHGQIIVPPCNFDTLSLDFPQPPFFLFIRSTTCAIVLQM